MLDFEEIEKNIQKFKPLSLSDLIFERLIIIQKNPKYLYPFWRLLVLLKWSFVYSKEVKFQRKANNHDLDKLIKLIDKFEGEYNVISLTDHKKVAQFFRIIAYQQFAYQEHYSNSIIDRQLVIYHQLKGSDKVEREFKKLTGIEVLDFFSYCYLTFLYLHLDELGNGIRFNGRLNDDFFNYFLEKYSKDELDKFLNLLTVKEAKEFEGLHRLRKEILQLYETNFFVTKPFIYFKGKYRIPHKAVFLQTVCYFVYNYLKRNSTSFPENFGHLLEQYVELGFQEINLSYQKEADLQKKNSPQKISDFLTETNILIEVKATELHPRSGVTRLSVTLQDDLTTSIIKAYSQLLSTASSTNNKENWYGIIITYKEMYLGFGSDAWDEFLKEPIEAFASEANIDIKVLPPENLFFVSISDWDWIIQALKENKALTLKKILKKGKECNLSADQKMKVFMMEQVLRKHFHVNQINLSYHLKAHQLLNILTEEK